MRGRSGDDLDQSADGVGADEVGDGGEHGSMPLVVVQFEMGRSCRLVWAMRE